jgi:secondary thiamine-phosphate synthase enzyme
VIVQQTLSVPTRGRGVVEITGEVAAIVEQASAATALCNVFVQHTSASLIVCENADPQVLRDLEAFLARLVPDGDPMFRHTAEGPDDMPAHVRAVLTQTSLTVPVRNARLLLGTWQGLYLYEHRHHPHTRRVTVTVHGN